MSEREGSGDGVMVWMGGSLLGCTPTIGGSRAAATDFENPGCLELERVGGENGPAMSIGLLSMGGDIARAICVERWHRS